MSRPGRPAPGEGRDTTAAAVGMGDEVLPFPEMTDLLRTNPAEGMRRLRADLARIEERQGPRAALNRLARVEVAAGLRRPSLAVYDHAFHLIGGAQRYGLTLAAALRDRFDVTLVANKDVALEDFRAWYGIDLAGCRLEVLRLPHYEAAGASVLDPALLTPETGNPFHAVSLRSGGFDVFVNNSMNEAVDPLAPRSVLVCHFPERRPRYFFYADRYDRIVYNSRYTGEWVGRKWGLRPTDLVYPPIEAGAPAPDAAKRKIILSVARFEPEGTKRQAEMLEAFLEARAVLPGLFDGWTLVLAGGSEPANRYLERLRGRAARAGGAVELRVNAPSAEIATLYAAASIFWHLCGLGHRDPSEVEHFGMTTVEAMRSRAVPVVYDGGGLREIVDDGVDGVRVRTGAELLEATVRLMRDPAARSRLASAAEAKAGEFSKAKFETRIRALFDEILADLKTAA